MKKNESDRPSWGQPAQIIPILRGLLANPTGDPDMPWEPVILKSITSKEALDFAGDEANAKSSHYPKPLTKGPKPPLFVTVPEQDAGPDDLRKQMEERIAQFAAQHGGKPDIVCLRDLGVLYIDRAQEGADLPLRNKVALVTGAAGAIGYGVCRGLLEKGCHVAATDLAGEKLDRFVADLSPMAPDRMIPVALDVTSKESVAAGFEAVIRTWGGIDIVVVNAGIAMVSPLKEMDLEAFRTIGEGQRRRDIADALRDRPPLHPAGNRGRHRHHLHEERSESRRGLRRVQRHEGGLSPARPDCQHRAGPPRGPRQHGGAGRRVLGRQLQIRPVGRGGSRPNAGPGA